MKVLKFLVAALAIVSTVATTIILIGIILVLIGFVTVIMS